MLLRGNGKKFLFKILWPVRDFQQKDNKQKFEPQVWACPQRSTLTHIGYVISASQKNKIWDDDLNIGLDFTLSLQH